MRQRNVHWRRPTIRDSVLTESSDRQLIVLVRDKSSIGITVDGTVIDAQDTAVRVKERVWTWVGSTLDYVLAENDDSSGRLHDTRHHIFRLL